MVELEKEEWVWKKNNIINRLNDRLFKIGNELNKKVLCDNCKEKKIDNLIDRLFRLLDKLIDGNDWIINKLSNKLVETLKIIKNCIACKHKRKEIEYYFDGFHITINKIEYLLVELEKGESEWEKNYVIDELYYKLIKIEKSIMRRL